MTHTENGKSCTAKQDESNNFGRSDLFVYVNGTWVALAGKTLIGTGVDKENLIKRLVEKGYADFCLHQLGERNEHHV